MAEEYSGEVVPLAGGGPQPYTGEVLPLGAKPKPTDEESPYSFVNVARGVVEPALNLATGMIAKPVSDIAGLAALGKEAVAPTPGGGNPQGFAEEVRRGLTYEPKTKLGQAGAEYNPLALIGEAIGWGAGKAEGLVAPPSTSGPLRAALGYGVKGAIENAPVVLGAKTGAAAEARLPGKQAALDIARGENAMKDTGRDAFQAAGYITPPEQGIKAAAAGLAGKAKTEKIISEPNEANATRRLSAEVGTPEGAALSEGEFTRLKEETGKAYDAVVDAAGPRLEVTNEFRDAVAGTLAKIDASLDVNPSLGNAKKILDGYMRRITAAAKEPLPGEGGPGIYGTIEKTAQWQPTAPAFGLSSTIEQARAETPGQPKTYGSPELVPRPSIIAPSELTAPPSMPVATAKVPTLSTEWVKSQISDLRRNAKDDFRKGDSDAGTARLGLATQLEELVAANLAKTGEQGLIEAYRAARENFAKIYLLERITNDATGRVNLQKLASLSDTAAYKGVLTGEFKTAADFAKTYRKAAQRSTGEAAPRLTVFDGMFAVGSMFGGHPWAGALEIGGRLGIPKLAEKGLLQNKTPSYAPSGLSRATPNLLRALGIGTQAYDDRLSPPPP